jgi:hypothetical protein
MSQPEIDCFQRYLGTARLYLEFGCGGSTFLAAESPVPRIVSVESDQEWINRCETNPVISDAVRAGRLTLHHADVGATGLHGYPSNNDGARHWSRYYLDVWPILQGHQPDLILIDGRWRIACAMQVLLRTSKGATILFHDFWNRRHYQRPVLPLTEVVERVDTLAVLRRRADVDWRRVALTVGQHAFDMG